MDKDDDLFTHAEDADQILEDDVVHDVVTSLSTAHFLDSIECTLEWCRSEAAIKLECSLFICINECSHIEIVW